MTEQEMDLLGIHPCEYRFDHWDELRVSWRGGATGWAIVCCRDVYTKEGIWEYEPLPSSRDEAFFRRARFTLNEALTTASKLTKAAYLKETPPPYPKYRRG